MLAKVREICYRAALLASRRRGPQVADFLWFKPAVRTLEEFADLSARVNWYLPRPSVPLYVEGASRLEATAPGLAPAMDSGLVRDPGWLHGRPWGHPETVYWRLTPATVLSFIRDRRTAVVTDPNLHIFSESRGYARLAGQFGPHHPPRISKRVAALLQRPATGRTAIVMGTGPSASLLDLASIEADVRIVCNSVVRNLDLIRRVQPNVIAFFDPVFHMGPSRYAAAFRKDLLCALDECDAEIVTSSLFVDAFLANMPELGERTTILGALPTGTAWTWPTLSRPAVRLGTNILITIMLPLAFALADEVQIVGCDGRQLTENYFWHHSQANQYADELMQSAFDAHPGFFRNVNYPRYYELHCREFEEMLGLAEEGGKVVAPVTPSWIPALVTRGAPRFPAKARS